MNIAFICECLLKLLRLLRPTIKVALNGTHYKTYNLASEVDPSGMTPSDFSKISKFTSNLVRVKTWCK